MCVCFCSSMYGCHPQECHLPPYRKDFSLAWRAIIKVDWLAVGPRDAFSIITSFWDLSPHPAFILRPSHCMYSLPLPQRKT